MYSEVTLRTNLLAMGNVTGWKDVELKLRIMLLDDEFLKFSCLAMISCSLIFYEYCKLMGGHLTVAEDTFGKLYLSTRMRSLLVGPVEDEYEWAYEHLF